MTQSSLKTYDGNHYDIVIIGAGINGASAAQHLSASGYSTLVVDQADFASGATSQSSRLLHCGLRHLASGDNHALRLRPDKWLTQLVTAGHDMKARDEMVRSIPERLTQINFCLPVYSDDVYSPWQLDLAFLLLRLLSPFGISLDYRRLKPADHRQIPWSSWLRDRGRLTDIVVFREYLFNWPERIALDALFDAKRMGAQLLNYTRVQKLRRNHVNNHWQLGLSARSPRNFDEPACEDELTWISADLILNLAGAWIDEVAQQSDVNPAPRCAGIKGIHIAFQLPEVFSNWGLFTFNSIKEPMYCLPSNGIHYAGLTRRPHSGEIANVAATDDEIDWMLAELNRSLPKLSLSRADILYTWAGVNPLTRDPDTDLGSREIKIHDLGAEGLPNLLTLTGAPIVTHRRVARRLREEIARRLSPSGQPREPDYGRTRPRSNPNSPCVESDSFGVSESLVRHCAREEQVQNLDDLLLRRLGIGWARDQGVELAPEIAKIAAVELGWSQSRIDDEVEAYNLFLQNTRRRPKT